MCLIALDWQPNSPIPLRLVANRDELHARPAAAAGFWDDAPDILAGRDLSQGGTWLGLHRSGAFAALTNYRDPKAPPGERSRGALVAEFLRQPQAPLDYAAAVHQQGTAFAGFNLLVGDRHSLAYVSNRDLQGPRLLAAGTYGLSNALLDSPWPKLRTVRDGLTALLGEAPVSAEAALALMARREAFPDHQLPDTGVGLSMERLLSPPFICTQIYGTRCTTWVELSLNQAQLVERSFDPAGRISGEVRETLDLPPI